MKLIKIIKLILLLAITAGVMSLVRFVLTGYDSYLWLNWNLFLALVPIFLAWLVTLAKKKWLAFVLLLICIGFLPNAPYLVTDFIHIANVGPRSFLWYDGLMIFMYTLTGMTAWVVSVNIIHQHFYWKKWAIGFLALLSGFGVYLGRYIRFNTWNIITHPQEFFERVGNIIIHPLDHEPVILMTIVFTIILSVIYFSLTTLLHYETTKN